MNMEAQPANDGRWRVALGPVEKSLATAVAAAMLYGSYWLIGSVQSMLTQQQLTTQKLESMTSQLQAMNTQLADVPALKLELAKTSIRVDQHDEEIKELRQLKGLK